MYLAYNSQNKLTQNITYIVCGGVGFIQTLG